MATPRRSGLRLDADLRDTEFVRYFSIVQDAAKRLGCVFYLWSPEARDGQVGDVWCEDLSGWLVPAHDADAFEDVWRNSDPDLTEDWDRYSVFAIWSDAGDAHVSIKFENNLANTPSS